MEKFIAANRDINSKNLTEFESSLAHKVQLKKLGRNATMPLSNTMAKNANRIQARYGNGGSNLLGQARSSEIASR